MLIRFIIARLHEDWQLYAINVYLGVLWRKSVLVKISELLLNRPFYPPITTKIRR